MVGQEREYLLGGVGDSKCLEGKHDRGRKGRIVEEGLSSWGGDGDGDVDLQDLKSMFSGGGGMMDKVKGMFS